MARSVCQVDAHGLLQGIVERTHIEPAQGGAAFTENGETFTFVPAGTIVSMNLWGFQPEILSKIEACFPAWLDENLPVNPLKCEYFHPLILNSLIVEKKAAFHVLPTQEKWYGVTYQPDMPKVQRAIVQMKQQGLYPAELWSVKTC